MRAIDVELPGTHYRILVEEGLLGRLGAITASVAPHERALLAIDAGIAGSHGRTARDALAAAGYDVAVQEIVAEEQRKTLATVSAIYERMLASRLERRSPVVAVGGGVVGDVAGFAAATYLRGVPLVQVPTTLLAMVDASIGGKTGVNFPLPADGDGATLGKNLIGAFWQPAAVVADPRALLTLEARDLRCGLAECVKHALLAEAGGAIAGGLLAWIEANADAIGSLDLAVLTDLIERGARVKVGFVVEDEREAGRRALLNLGHTFAHAIEPIEELDLRHGEAVAIGLCAAAWCAVREGHLGEAAARRTTALLERLGLPTRLPRPIDANRLVRAMRYDKKVAGGRIRLVLPTASGGASVFADVAPGAIIAAWRAVGAAPSRGAGDEPAATP
jgi:3-dehydroquinate synthase